MNTPAARATGWVCAALVVTAFAWPTGAQELDAQIRTWTTLDFGAVRLENFVVTSVESKGRKVYADHQEVRYLLGLRGGYLALDPAAGAPAPALRLRLGDVQMLGTFRVAAGALEHPQSWVAASGDLRISFAGMEGPNARLFGAPLRFSDDLIYARSVSAVTLSPQEVSGALEFKLHNLHLSDTEIGLPGAGAPWAGDLRSRKAFTLRLDLETASLTPVDGSLDVERLEPSSEEALEWQLGRFHLSGSPTVERFEFASADSDGPLFTTHGLSFDRPVVYYERSETSDEPLWQQADWPSLVPIRGTAAFVAPTASGRYSANAERLSVDSLEPASWNLEPDPEQVAVLVASRQRTTVVPVGDEHVPFVSVGALLDVYQLLAAAEDHPGSIPRGYLDQTDDGFALQLRVEESLEAPDGTPPLTETPLACIAIGKVSGKLAGKALERMMRLNARPVAIRVAVAASLTFGPEIGLPLAWATYGALHCGAKPAGWLTSYLVREGAENFCEFLVGQAVATESTHAFSPFATRPTGLPFVDLTIYATPANYFDKVRAQIAGWQQVASSVPVSPLSEDGRLIATRADNRRTARRDLRRQAAVWNAYHEDRVAARKQQTSAVQARWQTINSEVQANNSHSLEYSMESIRQAEMQEEHIREWWSESGSRRGTVVEIPLGEPQPVDGDLEVEWWWPSNSSVVILPGPEDEFVIETRPAEDGTSDPGCRELGQCYDFIFAPVKK